MKERYLEVQNSNQGQGYARIKKPNKNKHEESFEYLPDTKEIQLDIQNQRYALPRKTSENHLKANQEEECMELKYVTIDHPIPAAPVEKEDEGASNLTKNTWPEKTSPCFQAKLPDKTARTG